VHGTAAGRSATLREGRKEASSWQNAFYRPYGLDGYRLAEERRYRDADAAAALAAFREARRATVHRIARLGDEQLSRPAVFEGYGAVTVLGIVRLLCSHDLQH
jgi:hypothetical protein